MAIVRELKGMPIYSMWGKFARPNGLGDFRMAWSRMGERVEDAGVYKRDGRWQTNRVIRARHYRPTNPQSAAQQTRRQVFANGVQAWHALSPSEKQAYNAMRYPARMSGFCRFMRKYMHENA